MLKRSSLPRSEHDGEMWLWWCELNISKHCNTCRDTIAVDIFILDCIICSFIGNLSCLLFWCWVWVLARSSHDVMQLMKYEILQCFNEFSVANWEFPLSPDGSGWAWSCFNKRAWSGLFYPSCPASISLKWLLLIKWKLHCLFMRKSGGSLV